MMMIGKGECRGMGREREERKKRERRRKREEEREKEEREKRVILKSTKGLYQLIKQKRVLLFE